MRIDIYCVLLLASATGCTHDVDFRALDARGEYENAFIEGEALAIDADGRHRVILSGSPIREERIAGSESVLLYLSIPYDPDHGFSVRDTRAFVVWSDISAQFSGFVYETSPNVERLRALESVQGRYTGTLRQKETGELRNVKINVKDAPVTKVESREEIDRRGYSDVIRDHLYRLEFDATDREYWHAEQEPARDSDAKGETNTREHD
jgi:hypothetical protein